jgi:hypothetical protein
MTIQELLDRQAGVVRRAQLRALGATPNDIRRWLRQRRLVAVYPGVYVNHTGPLTWVNRAWAGVLVHWPAALADVSAVNLAGDTIHVAVSSDATPVNRPGVRLHWLTDLDDRVLWNLGPPRVRFEDALLTVAGRAETRTEALALLADGCRRRRTTPARLAAELELRTGLKNRAWLLGAITETGQGIQSALESAYLRRVERPHGLPWGRRQHRVQDGAGVVYRDVLYDAHDMVVELDGRIGHELSSDRWDDMDRDLDAAVEQLLTIRLGWRHAEDQPCRTATRLAVLLGQRGWRGRPRGCGIACSAGSTPTIGVVQ